TLTAPAAQTASEGSTATFSLGSFTDPGTSDNPWTIDVTWGDGSAASHFTVSSLGAISQAHQYADNGSYTVSTTVTDKDGAISQLRAFTATVSNVAPSLTAPADQTANEGSAKVFDLGSYADPGANDAPWSVDVNWGDGSAHSTFTSSTRGTLGNGSHTYDDNGTYTMTVKVTDKDGGTGTSTSTVTVANVAPTATLNAPASVPEGSAIALSLTGASDPSNADTAAGFTYAFDCGSGYGSFGTASTASCPTTDNGSRTVRGQIKDKDGGVTELTKSVTIDNVIPTVTTANQAASEGSAATLALGSFADPGPDNPWGVDVTWGDGSAHYSATAAATGSLGSQSHTYADSGSYTVTVTVTDKDGGVGTSTFTVAVANVAPSSSLPATASAFINVAASLAFGPASDPSVPDTSAGFHYAYDCNNGALTAANYGNSATSNAVSCTWTVTGTYTVRGRIFDKDGGYTESTTVVTVTNPPPTVTFATGTTSIAEGTAAATQYSYSFTVGNGTTITAATAGCGTVGTLVAGSVTFSNTAVNFKCTFNTTDGTAASTSTVTAGVTRNDGATGNGSQAVAITNVAPAPTLTGPTQYATYLVNSSVMLTGAFTDPGPDGAWKVHIDWGDSTVSDLSVTSKSYATSHAYRAASPASPGYTTITVTVTDKDGGAGTTTRIIYVR
ncbi:MAG: hypothetical protein QOK22_572, partial [Gaiellaceae bacterium]|nr:hypothetical protein [Gaiellaceae bacterium]